MKRIISLALSLIMLLSSLGVLTVGALDGNDIANTIYTDESIAASKNALKNFAIKNLPDNFNCDIRDLPSWNDSDPKNDVDLLGMDLDFLYNNNGSFTWAYFDVFLTDANGNRVTVDGTPIMKITLDDLTLAFTNLNIYLQKLFYNIYGGMNLYTAVNAADITNFIGGILHHDFEKLTADKFTAVFNNKVPTSNEFYNAVSAFSGLSEIIEYNWIPRGVNFYKAVIDALGGTYTEFYEEYYSDSVKLGAKMIEGAVNKITTVGPIEFILDILKNYSSSYELTYREPTLALFKLKKDLYQAHIPANELNSFNGLLKLIFCTCDPGKEAGCFAESMTNVSHFCPIEFPTARFARATDTTELTVYLYYYLNLCGRYRGNSLLAAEWKRAIDSSFRFNETEKLRLKSLVDGFFLGDFGSAVDNVIVPLYKENISTAPDSIFDRFKNTILGFLKKIADYFDYLRRIFTGELDYGQGNSPFN